MENAAPHPFGCGAATDKNPWDEKSTLQGATFLDGVDGKNDQHSDGREDQKFHFEVLSILRYHKTVYKRPTRD
jgi:hypothetical protein